MSILERIARIAKANINKLLDQAEPPEQEVQSKIKELTEALQEGKAAAGTYGATFRRMEKHAKQLADQQAERTGQAQAAVAAGDDDTARKLLAEKVQIGERLGRLTPGLQEGRKTYDQLRGNLARLQDQLARARLKLDELRSRGRSAAARKAFGQQLDTADSLMRNDQMFDRMEDQVLQGEAEADIIDDIQAADVDLEQRSRELQVEAELAAMKEKQDPR